MRVAALGDAHLGRSYLPFTTPEGVNQRERDFEQSFEAAVDLALAQQPDVLVWLGDIFDHPRPTYRSFRIVQRMLVKIRDHGIPTVVISGNHDTPRLPGTGSPYTVLTDTFGDSDVHFACRMAYERFELPGLVVHAVPQMLTVEATLDALETAARSRDADRTNLLLTHPRITQVEPRYADINEIEVDAGMLQSDLVLLGHYHFHTQVGKGIWYAGSTDTFTFADDPDKPKGIVVLDTDTGKCDHIALEGQRPLITLESVEARGLSPAEVQQLILDRASSVPEGAVARLYLNDVDPEAYRLLDLQAVREAAAAGLFLKIEPTFLNASGQTEFQTIDDLGARWNDYLTSPSLDLTGFDRDRLKQMGLQYIDRATEEANSP
jgi:DNA repair exonuclease SbcCD nuclease subunit